MEWGIAMRVMLMAAAAAALATSAQAANLVVNGDFEAGDTGFSSDYVLHIPTVNQAEYSITTSPFLVHGGFANYGDHTSGSGNMMVVNGSNATTDRVWYEDGLSVLSGTTYYFSTWISSAHPASPAQLAFSINGVQIGATFMASATTGLWQQFYATWNSGAATTADVALVNQNTAFGGNDFALDDIVLDTLRPDAAIPEPRTWALMILGFGATGAMIRRRRLAAA
jgi:hypothetical protein